MANLPSSEEVGSEQGYVWEVKYMRRSRRVGPVVEEKGDGMIVEEIREIAPHLSTR